MRIAFLAFHGSIHTRRWVSWFARRGHDVHVLTCGDDPAVDVGGAYEVHDLGFPSLGKVGYIAKIPAVRSALKELDADVVHAHHATSYGALALAAGRHPYVVTGHGSDILLGPRNPLVRPIVRQVLLRADLVTVPSEQMCDAVRALAGDRPRVMVIQYGVEAEQLAAVADRSRASAATSDRPVRIVSARPLQALYNFDSLLPALGLLRDRHVAFTCDLFDDGPERDRLQALIGSLGLDEQIILHGRKPEDVVFDALAASDVYVSLAGSDGASIALLEAMALGAVPVVADIPANRAWVTDGVNGVLTSVDPVAVADAIERASALDQREVAHRNRALIGARADREKNLAALGDELEALARRPAAASSVEAKLGR